jgi:peptidoglycan/xylan/chitin deacetylase (PgdA/CDA1 family)
VLVLVAPALCAQVSFGGLDLASDNRLLYSAETEVPVHGSYRTALLGDVAEKSLRQLTVFPEHISYLEAADQLQIQNRFGVFRSSGELTGFQPVPDSDAFVQGGAILSGKLPTMQASPNGRFLVALRSTSAGYAELVLRDLDEDTQTTVASNVPMSLSGPPVRWSPSSEYFVYEKSGTLYYYSVEQLDQGRVLDESFRDIGPGSFRSVRWGPRGDLYYVSDSLVHRIQEPDFFARSFYEDLLAMGNVIGKIPFDYDANFDRFWISPNGEKILFNKGGRNLFLYVLQNDDFHSTGDSVNLPYLYLPRNTEVTTALWSELGTITVLAESIEVGKESGRIYRLTRDDSARAGGSASATTAYSVQKTEETDVRDIRLSPQEQYAAVLTSNEVVIKSYESWDTEAEISHPSPLDLIWLDEERFVLAGESRTELVQWQDPSRRLLALSQAEDYGFTEQGDIGAQVSGRSYRYDTERGIWHSADAVSFREKQVANESYRVYTDRETGSTYRNLVMVRKAQGTGTSALFRAPEQRYEPFPEREQDGESAYFTHGSRIRRREVSLVFNAIGSVEGLRQILNTLEAYDIRATFFLNGDFIRRHPGAAKEIAHSGHEVGSLFFTYFDMSDSQYEIGGEFIRQGLARTEDLFFEKTGKELSLLWHAPYYFVNSTVLSGAREMNYSYIGRDVDSLDWIPQNPDSALRRLYKPVPELIERVLDRKKPGSIISMTVGKPSEFIPGTPRDEYLFQYLDLLITRLTELGYEMVPVSTLKEHAR